MLYTICNVLAALFAALGVITVIVMGACVFYERYPGVEAFKDARAEYKMVLQQNPHLWLQMKIMAVLSFVLAGAFAAPYFLHKGDQPRQEQPRLSKDIAALVRAHLEA